MELKHSTAYNLRCQLTLHCGRTLTLQSLNQRMTYAGLSEGTPDAAFSDAEIKEATGAVGGKSCLIPPVRRNYLRVPGDMDRIAAGTRNLHIPEWLPMVRCIGSFYSISPARDPEADVSYLSLAWFQDEYALPILEPALGQILALDWNSLASDGSY